MLGLNPNNGRRKNFRGDYEAEMNRISSFKKCEPSNFLFLVFYYIWGGGSSQCFSFMVMILTSKSSIISAE